MTATVSVSVSVTDLISLLQRINDTSSSDSDGLLTDIDTSTQSQSSFSSVTDTASTSIQGNTILIVVAAVCGLLGFLVQGYLL